MRIKDGYTICKVGDSSVVLATGNTSMQLNGLVTLNETGEFIWNALTVDTTEDAVVAQMCKEFSVDAQTAKADVRAFVEQLERAGFLA